LPPKFDEEKEFVRIYYIISYYKYIEDLKFGLEITGKIYSTFF